MLRTTLAVAALLITASHADAANLRLLVGGAMSEPFREVGDEFAKRGGHTLDSTRDTTGALQARLRKGEKADIILVSAPGMDALEKEKLVMPGTRVELASASIGIAIRAGAPSPDFSTAENFKKTIQAAKSVAVVNPQAGGTSGMYLAGLFQRMGIAEEVGKKTVFGNQGTEIAAAVAEGRAELGLTFVSEMMPNKGVKIAGLLPAAIQSTTIYAVAIPVGSPNPELARAFIKAMQTPDAVKSISKSGLTPLAHKP